MTMPPAATVPPAPMPMPPPIPSRPIGVSILAILSILIGLGLFFLGLIVAALGGLFAVGGAGGLGLLAAIIGFVILILGILAIVAGIGLWRLRPWAWWLATITWVLIAVSNAVSSPPQWAVVVVAGFIVVYLILVKKHFGPRPMGM